MKINSLLFSFLLIILTTGSLDPALAQDNKENEIMKSFTTSLHATGRGMQFWYSEEEGGLEKISGVPYEEHNCSNCHVKSCEACHEKKDDVNGGFTVQRVKSHDVCLKCHFVENMELRKLEKENQSVDVHFQMGMECMDCHSLREMHGDGKIYNTFQQNGASDTRCENCHQELDATESHTVHNGKLHCNACHMENSVTCYNCHLNQGKNKSFTKTGSTFLVNKNDQVTTASLHTFVTNDRTMIVLAPFFYHTVMKEGRNCEECHDTKIVKDIRENKFSPFTWENGKLENVKGVIPVAEVMKWDLPFLKFENDKWLLLENDAEPELNYAGFSSPITQEQMISLGKEQSKK
ncbi:hypothetical protein ACFLTH_07440 [Bacteroidota bacterium]